MDKIFTVAVVGPTATGKTSLGIQIAKMLNGEIISADSMQIYKGISIASAAPTEEERKEIPHHLVEFLPTDAAFSVADYTNAAHECIKEVCGKGKTPVIVGGTGLYIDSLLNNIRFDETAFSAEIRENLEKDFDRLGGEKMLERLSKTDSDSAKELHPNNRRRIIRALEIYELTGKTKTMQNELSKSIPTPYETVYIGLKAEDREFLYNRINMRVDNMLSEGLIEEAGTMFSKERGKGATQAIGHKELFRYFEGEISLQEAVENLKRATRRYAKRQLTWFNRNEKINWINIDTCEDVFAQAEKIIKEKQCEKT